jgi:hypothetical protein
MIQIGDKVKFLNENLSGTVSRIIDQKTVNVMVEDGFEIPVLISEIIQTSAVEGPGSSAPASAAPQPIEQEGVFLAFEPGSTQNLQAIIINNSHDILLFSLSTYRNQAFTGLASGRLDPLSTQKLHTSSLDNFEQWPEYCFRLISHSRHAEELSTPVVIKLKFKPRDFLSKLASAPLTRHPSYLFKLDSEPLADLSKLKGFKFDAPAAPEKTVNVNPPAAVIDLHIQMLSDNAEKLNGSEILKIQMDHFRKSMEMALAHRFEKITFIHGLGNGTLKDSIRKSLQSDRTVRTWQDAGKDRFGYGATEIFFK